MPREVDVQKINGAFLAQVMFLMNAVSYEPLVVNFDRLNNDTTPTSFQNAGRNANLCMLRAVYMALSDLFVVQMSFDAFTSYMLAVAARSQWEWIVKFRDRTVDVDVDGKIVTFGPNSLFHEFVPGDPLFEVHLHAGFKDAGKFMFPRKDAKDITFDHENIMMLCKTFLRSPDGRVPTLLTLYDVDLKYVNDMIGFNKCLPSLLHQPATIHALLCLFKH